LASIINNKPIEAQEQFGAAMSSILKTRIDNMRQDVASRIYNNEMNESVNEQYGVYHQRPEDIKTAKEYPTKPTTLYHLSTHSTKNSAQKEVDNLKNRGYTGFLFANKISDAEKMPHKIVKDFK
jgi:hypothetical protein